MTVSRLAETVILRLTRHWLKVSAVLQRPHVLNRRQRFRGIQFHGAVKSSIPSHLLLSGQLTACGRSRPCFPMLSITNQSSDCSPWTEQLFRQYKLLLLLAQIFMNSLKSISSSLKVWFVKTFKVFVLQAAINRTLPHFKETEYNLLREHRGLSDETS